MKTLPPGWRWSTVGEVGSVQLGRQRHPDWHRGPEMHPYLRVANVYEDRIDTDDVKQMDFTGCFDRYKLELGDVLLNEGNSPEFLGRPAIYRGVPKDVAFTNTLIRFRAGPNVTPEWALAVFRHFMHSGRFARESRITTNIAHLSGNRFKSIEFPIPPIKEQRRIVANLDDHLSRLDASADCLRSASKRLMALDRSALDAHFGGDLVVPLQDLVDDISAGKSFGVGNTPAQDGEWGIIRVSAMTWGEFRPEENKAVKADRIDPRFEIREGDLLVSRANTEDYVGASVLVGPVRSRLLLSDKSLRIKPRSGVQAEWLWRALQAPSARRQISALATGTKDSMRNISQAALLHVLLPQADEGRQTEALAAYGAVADSTARLRGELASSRSRLEHLRRSLLSAAFTGQLTPQPERESAEEVA